MRVVTFGEIMLRISPLGYDRFFQNDKCRVCFGGAEANVAVSLANFGIDSRYITCVPKNEIGASVIRELKSFGVDTQYIKKSGERLGIYYAEKGASARGGLCVYDRKYSSFSTSKLDDYNWDEILSGVDLFHFTGITLALGDNIKQICLCACKESKKRGIKISFDTNYRSKLWTIDEAKNTIDEFMPYVDILFTNPGDSKDIFGILSSKKDYQISCPDEKGTESIGKVLFDKYNLDLVFLTMRTNRSASINDFQAMVYDGNYFAFSKKYEINIVDRIGGGDSFCAGVIYSYLNYKSKEYMVEMGVSASVLKHTIEGDFNRATIDEIEKLAFKENGGRTSR